MTTGWQTKRLGELTEHRPICYGVLKPGERQTDGVGLVRVTDIRRNSLDESNLYLITDELSSEFKRSVLSGGEVLLSIQGTVGKVAIAPPTAKGMNVSRTIAVIDPDQRVDRNFLRYWLLSREGRFPITGSTRASFNIGDIRKLEVPLPHREEQKRIVAILDAAFADIDQAEANVAVGTSLRSELFDSFVRELLKPADDNWTTQTVGSLGKVQTGSTPRSSDSGQYGDAIQFVKPAQFLPGGSLIDTEAGLSAAAMEKARVVPAGSVLMVCIGATIGKCASTQKDVVTNQQINALTPNEFNSPRFIYHAMQTAEFQKRVRYNAGQATLPIINKSKWMNLEITVPNTRAAQERIADRLDLLFEEGAESSKLQVQKADRLTDLRQSLLHQAFTGQL